MSGLVSSIKPSFDIRVAPGTIFPGPWGICRLSRTFTVLVSLQHIHGSVHTHSVGLLSHILSLTLFSHLPSVGVISPHNAPLELRGALPLFRGFAHTLAHLLLTRRR